jgi:hypothetical protein
MKDDDAITAHEFLQEIYRNEEVALPVRMRAAIESLPFETPKLASTTNLNFDASFAVLLDKAIERSQRPLKLIEAQPVPTQQSAEELKGPMSRLRRL